MKTVKLRSGREVLAHEDGTAKTFANRTQAQNACIKHAGLVVIQRGRPFYAAVDTDAVQLAKENLERALENCKAEELEDAEAL